MTEDSDQLKREREGALQELENILEGPMIFLAFLWLVLTVVDLISGLSLFFQYIMNGIWIIFWMDFLIEFTIAPKKKKFLSSNWLTLLALIIPAFRLFRIVRGLRLLRLMRGTRLVRVIGSFNRGMNVIGMSFGRRGFKYILALSLIVIFLGAGGIYAFEHDENGYMSDFATAVWWSSMMLTTMGSDYFPKSPEGRILAFFLAVYGFAVFGYVTAAVASFFVDSDAAKAKGTSGDIKRLEQELREIKRLLEKMEKKGP